ncbi:hypothetical protein AMAG_09837 [Allomyces macrogynus ATCC 38327]|uniref:Uncharacterized protein n=1 Tax=Allomyces macrogynus (strain ATCC 38327) TaxID=578462 RepID=A0A0L0STM1_ALLM3|nr:hypothetical protein AMAG_09837 [Allomyces macrogynus ATCC 38327]|eukprot:KNE65872.1 hypothetical protein AMAG_09837 [Allomyces macrogynus ATCC 38327]
MNSNSNGSSSNNTQPPLPPLPPPRTNITGSVLAAHEESTGHEQPSGMVYPPLGYEHLRPTSPTPTGSAVLHGTGNHDPRTSLLLGPVPPMVTVPPMVSSGAPISAMPPNTGSFAGSFAAAPYPAPTPAPVPVPVPVSATFMGAVTTAPIARMSSIGPGVGVMPYPPVSGVGVAPYPPASGVAPYPPASGVTPYPPISAEYGAPLAVTAAVPVMAQVPPTSYLSGVAPSIHPGAMDGSAPVPIVAPVAAVPLQRQTIGTDPNGNYFLVERTDPDGVTASHGTIIVPFGRPSEAALATPIDPTPPPPISAIAAPAPAQPSSDPDPSPPRPVRPGASLWTETRPQVRPHAWATVPFWLKSLTAIMSIVGLVLAVNTLPDSAAALRATHTPTSTTSTASDSRDAPFIAAYLWLMVLSLAYCLTYLILFSGCFYSPFSQKINVSPQRQGWKLVARRWMLMPVEAGLMSAWAIIALIMGFLHAPFALFVTSCPDSGTVAVAGIDDVVVPATGVSCYDAKVLLGVASTVAILWGLNAAHLFYGIWKNQAKIEHLAQVQQEVTGRSQ